LHDLIGVHPFPGRMRTLAAMTAGIIYRGAGGIQRGWLHSQAEILRLTNFPLQKPLQKATASKRREVRGFVPSLRRREERRERRREESEISAPAKRDKVEAGRLQSDP